jgi:hypothetical protein
MRLSNVLFVVFLLLVTVSSFTVGYMYRNLQVMKVKAEACSASQLCPNALEAQKRLRSYQLETFNDSTVIWDGDRPVATLRYDSTSQLDKVISTDNQ